MHLLHETLGLQLRSPMLDRRVIELRLGMPAHLLLDPMRSRPLQRAALAGRAPPELVTQTKEQRFYRWMQARGLRREAAVVAANGLTAPARLADCIDVGALGAVLRDLPVGADLPMALAEQVGAALALLRWEHGVRATPSAR
jgi:hypothetical protein